MPDDFEIGRVLAVDTSQVTIELNADLKALTRSTYEGAQDVGRINSYVIAPVGGRRLVAMVTRVSLVDEASLSTDRSLIMLPSAKRMMKATLIGTIDSGTFTQGISVFPVLDNPVLLTTATDLDAIFDRRADSEGEPSDPNEPGCCIDIGRSAVFDRYPIQIDPDAFFGKHAAVLGSTGSGKSCTIASIIQAILSRPAVRRTQFVILDTNGEYRAAFEGLRATADGSSDAGALHIPSTVQDTGPRLVVPYWFMNADDFVGLFRAGEGLQSPVLLRALRLARAGSGGSGATTAILDLLRTSCLQVIALTQNDTPTQQSFIPANIVSHCDGSTSLEQEIPAVASALQQAGFGTLLADWKAALDQVRALAQAAVSSRALLGSTRAIQIQQLLEPFVARLTAAIAGHAGDEPATTADQPSYFDVVRFVERTLDVAMREQADSGNIGRVRDACSPMFLRIRRFIEDPRFTFLLGRRPDAKHSLAAFLRDSLGLPARGEPAFGLSDEQAVEQGRLPFYDRQRAGAEAHSIVIIDLSLLASEVLENVTATIGRVILEFLQRLGDQGDGASRGSLPVVLFLEEAQNYIRETRSGEEDSVSRRVFERIAREGRKYGLGLVVSSQRPSELSKTVLSQCSSFIVHRLQNPEDLRYFKDIVPGVYAPLLEQLPALAPQTALVLGECVRAPAIVRVREAVPRPRSNNPRFYANWVSPARSAVPVEEVCANWEGRRPPAPSSLTAASVVLHPTQERSTPGPESA